MINPSKTIKNLTIFAFLLIFTMFDVKAQNQRIGVKPVFTNGADNSITFDSPQAACEYQYSSGLRSVRTSNGALVILEGPRFWIGSSWPGNPPFQADVEYYRPYENGVSGYLCHAEYLVYWTSTKVTEKMVDSAVWIYPVCPLSFLPGSYPLGVESSGSFCPVVEPPCNDKCPDNLWTDYPFNVYTGEKKLSEVDYVGGINQRLRISRVYKSFNYYNKAVGNWYFNFQKNIKFRDENFALLEDGRGSSRSFYKLNDAWIGEGHRAEKLKQVDAISHAFELINIDDAVERFDASGRLLSIIWPNGYAHNYTYFLGGQSYPAGAPNCLLGVPSNGQLLCITETGGRQIGFVYDENHLIQGIPLISKVIDPAGRIINYVYGNKNVLSEVRFSHGAKRYLYDEHSLSALSNRKLLTGIEEEISEGIFKRFASYSYDGNGAAISGLHAGGVNKYTGGRYFDNAWKARKIDPNGNMYVYSIIEKNGMSLVSGMKKPAGVGFASASSNNVYDANANLVSRVDFAGNLTTYTYDLSRNLETKRVEASGRLEAKTISTQWHATYRIPVQIDEPLRRTTFTHDANGNVLTKTEQATTDTNGSQGAAAMVVGAAKVWTYTYNNFGQVLTAKGPRTDINDLTSYVYDNQGNLTSVTNPAGHVTSMSNYDAHGHVGLITDPNGVTTALTYHPRGWLLSRAVTADGVTETTSYTYDGVGQMTQVTLPDNSVITYTYDDAHRLTKVSDHLGNSITYTLDNMGNRTKEEVKDTSGTLTQQVTRVYDILNRLKEVTGGMQ